MGTKIHHGTNKPSFTIWSGEGYSLKYLIKLLGNVKTNVYSQCYDLTRRLCVRPHKRQLKLNLGWHLAALCLIPYCNLLSK